MSHILNFVNPVEEIAEHRLEDILDMFADTGTAVLGYQPNEAMNGLPSHVPHVIPYENREVASDLLCVNNGYDRVFWSCSGEQAVEAMLKFARKATGRTQWAVPDTGQFHGRTYGAMSISVDQHNHYDGHYPMVPDVLRFMDPMQITEETACVVLTPGLLNKVYEPYKVEWVREICNRAKRMGALVCFDEVQTFLRLGTDWGWELYGIDKPDMIATAKGIAAGIPCGITLLNDDVADKLAMGGHFNTFGASPRACVGVIQMQTIKDDPDFRRNILELGFTMYDAFKSAGYEESLVYDGSMFQVAIPGIDRDSLVRNCAQLGVLVQMPKEPIIKLTPPLIYTPSQVKRACDIIISVIPMSMKGVTK